MKPHIESILAVTIRNESSVRALRKVVPFLPYVSTPSESSLRWSTQKHLMRDRLRNYDARLVPRYSYVTEYTRQTMATIVTELRFPVIVKPNGLAASILVTRCNNETELSQCLKQVFQVITVIYSRDLGRGTPSVLVEEMIQGDMYSTDAYVSAAGKVHCLPLVKVITAESLGLPGFYSYRHIIPTGLSMEEIEAANTASIAAIRALNLNSSTAHIELFQSPEGWKIIEVGPRIGGYREALYRESYGVDHYYNDLAVKIGLEPSIGSKPIGHAAGINIYPDQEGHIQSIEGIEEARKVSSVVFLEAHAKTGDVTLFAGNGGRLIVDGILSNKDPKKLEADVAKVRELVKIKVKQVAGTRLPGKTSGLV